MTQNTASLQLSERLNCFVKLGEALKSLDSDQKLSLAARAKYANPWFEEKNVLLSLSNLAEMLAENNLKIFSSNYSTLDEPRIPKSIGVIMAGNIPAVGFHDALCVLLAGHTLLAKLSKDDTVLMCFLFDKITEIEPRFAPFIQVVERLTLMDAVVCTGSNNSARYFEHYFGKYPNIIRKNRTSVAVLDGTESPEEIALLAEDIFTYYGLGCRNVSKLFIPQESDITKIIDHVEHCSYVINQHKYANNYTYNRAIYLLNLEPFLDNDFAIFKESDALNSPLSVIHYERYCAKAPLLEKLKADKDNIQCIVSKCPEIENKVAFGEAQKPNLSDFADGVDTMEFLLDL